MKRLYGLFVLLCLMLTACNDDFLDVDPVDRYSDAVVWTDESLYLRGTEMGISYRNAFFFVR